MPVAFMGINVFVHGVGFPQALLLEIYVESTMTIELTFFPCSPCLLRPNSKDVSSTSLFFLYSIF